MTAAKKAFGSRMAFGSKKGIWQQNSILLNNKAHSVE
jgi:hypothetical protein